jgi:general secretion pathway protein C
MRKTFTIISILLLAIAVYFGVNVVYEIIKSGSDNNKRSKTGEEQLSSPTDEKSPPLSDYKKSVKRRDDIDTEGMPETELNLKLWGTILGGGKKPYAVIEDTTTKKQNLYREGDTVQGAEVKRILREKVILHINDRDEVLSMEISGSGKEGSPPTDQLLEPSYITDTDNITIKRSSIDKAIEDGRYSRYAKIMPHFENANIVGFEVKDIKPNSIFRKMGLKDGDIITNLDGKKFRKTEEVLDYYRSLPPSEGFTLEIIRDGEGRIINYSFD